MTTQRHPIKLQRTERHTYADCTKCSWSAGVKNAPGKSTKAQARQHTLTTAHTVTIHQHTQSITKPIQPAHQENP